MGRIAWASAIAVLYVALAAPGFAQTNEACMLRCLDRGNLDQTCEARCTKGVPPAETLKPNHATAPAQQPATQSAPPLAAQPSPASPQPASIPPSPPPAGQSAPQPAQNLAPVQPAQNQAPPQPAAQTAPQQVAKPPSRPVNEACVLRCLDHGHLDQYCEAVCAH